MFFSWYLAIQLKLPSLKRWVGFTWIMQEGEDTLPLPHNHWVFRSWQQCLFTSENWQIGRKLADLMLPNYGRWVGSQIPTLENRKFNSCFMMFNFFWNFSLKAKPLSLALHAKSYTWLVMIFCYIGKADFNLWFCSVIEA